MVYFISLGPGDISMLTCEACDVLSSVSVVIAPGRRTAELVRRICGKAELIEMDITMSSDRCAAMAEYDRMCSLIVSRASSHDLAVVVEGDCSVYASVHYVMDMLVDKGYEVRQLPGVPSFVAAAAQAGISLVSQDESLVVLPGSLSSAGQMADTTVVMKLSRCEDYVKQLMSSSAVDSMEFHYFEYVCMPNSFYSRDVREIMSRKFPYFSLMIIKKNR